LLNRNKNSEFWLKHEFIVGLRDSEVIKDGYNRDSGHMFKMDRVPFVRVYEPWVKLMYENSGSPVVIRLMCYIQLSLEKNSPILRFRAAELAKEFGYKRTDVIYDGLNVLEKAKALQKISLGVYIINPSFIYSGDRTKLCAAVDVMRSREDYYGIDEVSKENENTNNTENENAEESDW
jgi:hypothetical protein